MISLAIETATDRLSVAGKRGEGQPEVREVSGARRHAAQLFSLIDQVLGQLRVRLEDVDALAVADGPGSFTGLRVGFSAAKALARTQPRLALWTASTLLVRAAGAGVPRGARVLVVTSALRGDLYAASYRLELPGSVEILAPPSLATPESLHRETPDLLVADAPDKLVDRLAVQFAVPLIRGNASQPNATALLGLIAVPGAAELVKDPDDWEPRYGRPAEAQVRWEALHGRSLSNSSGFPR
jgi:tRNA threonylcarbamoyladenosine biosynthesis protein TsaB